MTTDAQRLIRQQRATRLLFLLVGAAVAAWAAIVPQAQARAGVDAAGLGLLLLCLGAGSIMTMPLAGALCARLGCRAVLAAATVLIVGSLPLLSLAASPAALGATLFVFGCGVGALDCAVNLQAVLVEQASGRPMMSGFHAYYSLGGIVGAAGMSAAMSLGAGAVGAMAAAAGLLALTGLASWGGMLAQGGQRSGPAFALPHGPVLFIGVLAFVMFLAEGAMLDWSAVFLTQVQGLPEARAGLGYAVFALAMTLGRFGGDAMVRALSPRAVVVFGALLAAHGIAISVAWPVWQLSLLGQAVLGFGAANVVPVLFSLAARQGGAVPGAAIAAVSTLGYAGVLCGPAGIGLLAHHTGLRAALLALAAAVAVVGLAAVALRVPARGQA